MMCKKLLFLTSFVLVLCLVLTSVTQAELIGWWRLDETSGNIAEDSSGKQNDGNVEGTPKWVPGKMVGALELGGSDYVVIDGVADDVTNNNVTLCIWVKTNSNDAEVIACNTASAGNVVRLAIDNGSLVVDESDPQGHSTTRIGDGEWHFCTYVRREATGYIYVDGIQENSYQAGFNFSANDLWSIGQEWDSGGPSGFLAGTVDDARIYDHPLMDEEIQAVMKGEGWPYAFGPDPADGSYVNDTWVNLSWRPGDFAVSHDVYFSENFDDVDNGTGDAFRGNQTSTFYAVGFPGFAYPEGLVPGTTYYWRIDEVNETNPDSPWRGDIWLFSIPPRTAYNPNPADGAESVGPDDVTLSWTAGYGAKLHTVYFGDDFDTVNNATGGTPLGVKYYNAGTLEGEKVYYWRVDEFDAITTHKGDVWSFTTPGAVGNPKPAFDATDVQMNVILSWTPADSAASHQLCFGTDKDAVRNAGTGAPEYVGSKSLGDESHDPGLLEPDTAYYWRVDEVDGQGNTSKGPLWVFTTGGSLLIDDFEGYTDDDTAGEAIWQTWIDGFGVPDNGAQVGNLLPPYCEQTIVHGGAQSMPLFYVNEAGVTNSEGVLPLTAPRDWTVAGVAALSLWFRGVSGNAAEPLYVAISNAAGAPAIVTHDDAAAATNRKWSEWRVPLQAFADQGINLTSVDKFAVGLGSKSGMAAAGGSGTMYVDDIRLNRP